MFVQHRQHIQSTITKAYLVSRTQLGEPRLWMLVLAERHGRGVLLSRDLGVLQRVQAFLEQDSVPVRVPRGVGGQEGAGREWTTAVVYEWVTEEAQRATLRVCLSLWQILPRQTVR